MDSFPESYIVLSRREKCWFRGVVGGLFLSLLGQNFGSGGGVGG